MQAIVKQAMDGNVRAAEYIRDTIGQKPIDHVELQHVDFEALDAVKYDEG